MTVSYQDRHHLQQEVALGARLTDLPTSSSSPQPPTKVPCPPGTEPHLPRTGSGSGSSWRQYRRRYWGPKVCRRPESLLKKGRLSVAFWEGDFPKRRGRGAHSARRSGPTAAFSGALLADLQNPRKHALLLPRNVVSIHSTLTARGGGGSEGNRPLGKSSGGKLTGAERGPRARSWRPCPDCAQRRRQGLGGPRE